MRKYLLFSVKGILGFIKDVEADGGFVVDNAGIQSIFADSNLRNANILCPMRAGNVNKLYFQRHGT